MQAADLFARLRGELEDWEPGHYTGLHPRRPGQTRRAHVRRRKKDNRTRRLLRHLGKGREMRGLVETRAFKSWFGAPSGSHTYLLY